MGRTQLSRRSFAGPVAADTLHAVLIKETWVKACGKLPSRRRFTGSYSSDKRPTSLQRLRRRSNNCCASEERPCSARLSASQNVHGRKTPSPRGKPSTSSFGL